MPKSFISNVLHVLKQRVLSAPQVIFRLYLNKNSRNICTDLRDESFINACNV